MIWHLYGNNSNNDKVIMSDSSDQMIHQYRTFTPDDEARKTSFTSPNAQSLFLNFTSNPNTTKKAKEKHIVKKTSTSSTSSASPPPSPASHTKASIKVNGVNILNRKNLDSKTVVDRIQKRRENHNHIEKRRRNCINNTISELSRVIPSQQEKLNKHNVLKSALDHILYLQSENALIKQQLLEYSRTPVEGCSQHYFSY